MKNLILSTKQIAQDMDKTGGPYYAVYELDNSDNTRYLHGVFPTMDMAADYAKKNLPNHEDRLITEVLTGNR
jgi:hypothetical protein